MKKRIWKIHRSEGGPWFRLESVEALLYFDSLHKNSFGWTLYLNGNTVGTLSEKQHNIINWKEFADEFEEK